MAFNIGLSGLHASQADLKATGNNIANTGTIGFKASRAEFANIYSVSKFTSTNTAIGSGVRVAGVTQQFTQGNLNFTEKNLDLAINGEGFYNVEGSTGETVYTRNGQFQVDNEGFIVTNNHEKLLGYDANQETDLVNTGSVAALNISASQISPNATTTAELVSNIDASASVNLAANIDPNDPSTYTHTTSFSTFDSLGNAMLTSVYFQKTADNSWTLGTRTVDSVGNALPADTGTTPVISDTNDFFITFDTTGKLETIGTTSGAGDVYDNSGALPTGTSKLTLDYTAAGTNNGPPTSAADQTILLDISSINQYGAKFAVNDLTQDGYSTGNLAGIEVDPGGLVLARYTNGKSKTVGQVIISNFNNPQGLSQLGGNNWAQTSQSGEPIVNLPGSSSAGSLQSGALEEANVDLTNELIKLIVSQRNFQANAKTITTSDTLTQTVIQI